MGKKKANQVKDFQHKFSKTMIENAKANTIIVDDFSMQQMTLSKKIQ